MSLKLGININFGKESPKSLFFNNFLKKLLNIKKSKAGIPDDFTVELKSEFFSHTGKKTHHFNNFDESRNIR